MPAAQSNVPLYSPEYLNLSGGGEDTARANEWPGLLDRTVQVTVAGAVKRRYGGDRWAIETMTSADEAELIPMRVGDGTDPDC